MLTVFQLYKRVRNKAFTLLVRRSFDSLGANSVLFVPIRLHGTEGISIGTGVSIGEGSWIQTLADETQPKLRIGNGTSIAGACFLSAALSIDIGQSVLIARNVYISDHSHAYNDAVLPILAQGLDRLGSVVIEDGAWLGQNVVVLPGVTIGRGSVIGANSVVAHDVPPRCVAVGAPAIVVRSLPG